jgi:hypothetical protein
VIAIFIIDRFEGDWVVVEFEGGTFNVPRVLFPQQVREGDVVKINIIVDEEAISVIVLVVGVVSTSFSLLQPATTMTLAISKKTISNDKKTRFLFIILFSSPSLTFLILKPVRLAETK